MAKLTVLGIGEGAERHKGPPGRHILCQGYRRPQAALRALCRVRQWPEAQGRIRRIDTPDRDYRVYSRKLRPRERNGSSCSRRETRSSSA